MSETTPPPYDGTTQAAAPEPAEYSTPMYGSTASRQSADEAAPAVDSTFLSNIRPGFWD